MATIQTFDYSINLLRAILWQYNDALNLQGILEQKQGWYDANQTGFWEDWYRDVFDLRTANNFGLSVWAIILNVPISVAPQDDAGKPIFGFASDDANFNNGNFTSQDGITLTAEQIRLILRLRYFQLVTRGAVTEINAFLATVFADMGPAYVQDLGGMSARYVFEFALPSELELVLSNFDVLPRPAAVDVSYTTVADADGFGFGRYHYNFENGNFYHA